MSDTVTETMGQVTDSGERIVWSPSILAPTPPPNSVATTTDTSNTTDTVTVTVTVTDEPDPRREVVGQGEEFAVVSNSSPERNGQPIRAYGVFADQATANERLAELDHFAERFNDMADADLAGVHDKFHALDTVTVEQATVHDLVEDELATSSPRMPWRFAHLLVRP